MKKHNQNGFGLVEALLIIIAAGIVGFGGYYVWHNQHNKTNSKTATTTPATTNSPSTGPAQQYLTIKEWGVQLAVPTAMKGLTYSAKAGTSITGEPTTFAYFTSDDFKAFLTSCGATDTSGSTDFAGANKVAGVYPSNPTPQNSDGALLKQFDGFYIEGSADQQSSPCSGSQNVSAKRTELFNSLVSAFKTATLAQ